MTESKVMQELRKTRDKMSDEIKDMNSEQMKEYFNKKATSMLNEINSIREQKLKAI
ncbi:MAG: hypothetical protein H7Y41_05570 [Hyphomonadaceae bacterium]|nr:hypothetical protein [Clostridia bacterium]